MPVWRGSSAVPSVGPEIHLKYAFLGLSKEHKQGAVEALGLARIMLREILSVVNKGSTALTENQRAIMDYYFVFGGDPPSTNDFKVIQATLTMTANGLMGEKLNLKITEGGDAYGYVNKHDSRFGLKEKLRSGLGLKKSRWTPGIDYRSGTLTRRGDIHLDTDRLETGPELSAKTIIHEATHKFASTADFGEKGYTDDDTGAFRAPGLKHAEALNNAESYARFVMMSFLFP